VFGDGVVGGHLKTHAARRFLCARALAYPRTSSCQYNDCFHVPAGACRGRPVSNYRVSVQLHDPCLSETGAQRKRLASREMMPRQTRLSTPCLSMMIPDQGLPRLSEEPKYAANSFDHYQSLLSPSQPCPSFVLDYSPRRISPCNTCSTCFCCYHRNVITCRVAALASKPPSLLSAARFQRGPHGLLPLWSHSVRYKT
jgi:hypothetical protein